MSVSIWWQRSTINDESTSSSSLGLQLVSNITAVETKDHIFLRILVNIPACRSDSSYLIGFNFEGRVARGMSRMCSFHIMISINADRLHFYDIWKKLTTWSHVYRISSESKTWSLSNPIVELRWCGSDPDPQKNESAGVNARPEMVLRYFQAATRARRILGDWFVICVPLYFDIRNWKCTVSLTWRCAVWMFDSTPSEAAEDIYDGCCSFEKSLKSVIYDIDIFKLSRKCDQSALDPTCLIANMVLSMLWSMLRILKRGNSTLRFHVKPFSKAMNISLKTWKANRWSSSCSYYPSFLLFILFLMCLGAIRIMATSCCFQFRHLTVGNLKRPASVDWVP